MGADIVAIWMGRIILAVLVTVVLVWMLRRVGSTLTQLVGYIEVYLQKRGRGIHFRSVEVLSADAIHRFILSLVGTARVVATVALLYAWLLVVAWSLDASKRVFGVVEQPLLTALSTAGSAIINFIPNLMMLVVIVVLARVSTRVIAILTEAVGEQRLHFDWLPTELAVPTRRLGTILVWGLALVMSAPYLPGSESKAFLGVCIMLGILISLGSTSITSNLLSGLVLTYARTYGKGDWVEIGDVVGDVVNLGPFTTRIRTIKDEEVIIPNAVVQAGSVRNFTRYAAGHGVQIHTEVTAGYDVPWRTMHRVLLEAAAATDGARSSPAPYVLARSLDAFSVRYELYAYCDVPRELHLVEARMCQAILDACAKEGVDISAPHLRRSHEHAKSPPRASIKAPPPSDS